MKALLTKVKSNHNNLRTDTVEGESIGLPIVGSPVIITSEPLVPEDGDVRMVYTTNVVKIDKISEKSFRFETKNSTYLFEVLEP